MRSILLMANCEFLYKTQSKELQEKEYAMNITCDHTPFAQVRVLKRSRSQTCTRSRSHVFDLLACMHVQLLIVENDSSILKANCQHTNHPAKCNYVPQTVWYSINSPSTCSRVWLSRSAICIRIAVV